MKERKNLMFFVFESQELIIWMRPRISMRGYFRPFVYTSILPSIPLPIHPSIYLSAHPRIHLSDRPSFCPHVLYESCYTVFGTFKPQRCLVANPTFFGMFWKPVFILHFICPSIHLSLHTHHMSCVKVNTSSDTVRTHRCPIGLATIYLLNSWNRELNHNENHEENQTGKFQEWCKLAFFTTWGAST